MGAFLCLCDCLPSRARALFLLDARDREQTLAQAARQAAAQCCAARGTALAFVLAQRALVAARVAAFFWLAVRFSLTSLLFELAVCYVSMSWLADLGVSALAPELADNERASGFPVVGGSYRIIWVRATGTVVLVLALGLIKG